MKLENNLRRLRFEKDDMTQDALAGKLGVARQTINSIEKGRFVPSTLLALKIARFFNKPFDQVFYLKEK